MRSYCPPYCTCEEVTRFHDETSAVNHEDQMAGQSDKHKSSQAGRTPFYGRPPHQKESPLDRNVCSEQNQFNAC